MARRRSSLRAEGYRPIQLGVPDLCNREVLDASLRDMEAIRRDPHKREYLAALEAAAAEITEWEY